MKNQSKELNDLIKALNQKLMINHTNWHKLKGDKNRRAAELISSALSQLIIGENENEAILYLEESLKWMKGEIKDKPCPHKKSSLER